MRRPSLDSRQATDLRRMLGWNDPNKPLPESLVQIVHRMQERVRVYGLYIDPTGLAVAVEVWMMLNPEGQEILASQTPSDDDRTNADGSIIWENLKQGDDLLLDEKGKSVPVTFFSKPGGQRADKVYVRVEGMPEGKYNIVDVKDVKLVPVEAV